MKHVEITICTDPGHYTEEANLFKQLNFLLSAKMKSQVRLAGFTGVVPGDGSVPPCRVWVNDTPVDPIAGSIIEAAQRALKRVALGPMEQTVAA